MVGIFPGVDLFFNGKLQCTQSMARGPWAAPVHGGLGHGRPKGLAEARPSDRSGARWLTGGGTTERGLHGESISGLTGVQAAAWRPGDDGEEAVVVALGAGCSWPWREEKDREMCSGGWRGSPFI
jgi:hypothetical protein